MVDNSEQGKGQHPLAKFNLVQLFNQPQAGQSAGRSSTVVTPSVAITFCRTWEKQQNGEKVVQFGEYRLSCLKNAL